MLQFQTDQSFTNGAVVATYANSIEVTTNNGAGSFKIYVFIPGTYDVKFKFTRKSRPSDFKVIDA